MQATLKEITSASKCEEPRWFLLHGAIGAERSRWGAEMKALADKLVECGWVIWRDGDTVEAKHRCMMPN